MNVIIILTFALAACGRTDDTQDAQTEGRQESSQTVTESADNSTNEETEADTASVAACLQRIGFTYCRQAAANFSLRSHTTRRQFPDIHLKAMS